MAEGRVTTVGEMMELLKAFDPSLQFVVSGYEEGYDDPVPPDTIRIRERRWSGGGYMGKYEKLYDDGDGEGREVVVVGRW